MLAISQASTMLPRNCEYIFSHLQRTGATSPNWQSARKVVRQMKTFLTRVRSRDQLSELSSNMSMHNWTPTSVPLHRRTRSPILRGSPHRQTCQQQPSNMWSKIAFRHLNCWDYSLENVSVGSCLPICPWDNPNRRWSDTVGFRSISAKLLSELPLYDWREQ